MNCSRGGAGVEIDDGDPVAGHKIFIGACAACHGPAGGGVQGLSEDMAESEWITRATNEELFELIKTGRISDNQSGGQRAVMPPKGGLPSLTDTNLADLVAYIRSLQQ